MAAVGLRGGRGPRLAACLSALALAVSACSSTTPSSSAVNVVGSTLAVYASQPPGPTNSVSTDVLDAEQLAFAQAGATLGSDTVKLVPVHDREVSANARAAVADKTTIAYIGELAPGTSGVSVQITNQVGLLEISPTDTAVYLTQSTPVVSGAPDHYYPARATFHRTFARVGPTTAPEAQAQVAEMQALHVSRLSVSDDGSAYGAAIALEVRQDARAKGLTITSGTSGADGVFYGAVNGPRAHQALDQTAASDPSAKLFVPSALYDDTFVAGLSAAAQGNLYVTAPGTLPTRQTAAEKTFTSTFQSKYGHVPQPQAIYGYETMAALMAVLKGAGANVNSRALVVARFRALSARQSVLGTYSIKNGDSDLSSFVVAHPAGGRLVPRSQP